MDWEAARTRCLNHTAYLAEPKTESENNKIKSLAESRLGNESFWLGAAGFEEDKGFVWNYSRENVNSSFTDWAAGEPNNDQGGEDCLEMKEEVSYQWNDAPCDQQKPFVCQIGKFPYKTK